LPSHAPKTVKAAQTALNAAEAQTVGRFSNELQYQLKTQQREETAVGRLFDEDGGFLGAYLPTAHVGHKGAKMIVVGDDAPGLFATVPRLGLRLQFDSTRRR
jgi:hypothetical protein